MASENTAPDDGPAPDPIEAELVAYLDGELEPAAARKVEVRLAKDPAARARAAELKKSFDLLDYLPRPEPSPTFTTRTLDKLPAVKPAAQDVPPVPPAARPPAPRAANAASVSTPILLDEGEPAAPRVAHPRRYLWAAGLVAAVSAFAALGYLATAAVWSHPNAAHDKDGEDGRPDVNPRVVENLPLYAAADDLAFVTELARPDLFGEDPAVAYDTTLKVPAEAAAKPAGKPFDALAKAFRALPPNRQAEVVKLDQDLFAKEPKERDRLYRALEAYAVWLERLPEGERRGVLAAATPGLRLDIVRTIRDQHWRDALPPALRGDSVQIKQWREDETARRDRLAFVRQHAEAFAANKSPWPFDTDAGRKDVVEFARHAFKIPDKIDPKADDTKKCRLSPDELAEYKRTLFVAERDGAWAWYGLVVYELSKAHPYLPESDNPKLMFTETAELPPEVSARLGKKATGSNRLRLVSGKWPEFPLEAHRELAMTKFGQSPALGPARLADFKEPVRAFANRHLKAEEKAALQKLEGRWPEHPRQLVEYAKRSDLSVPGVTLPGPPSKWDATYGMRPQRPTN